MKRPRDMTAHELWTVSQECMRTAQRAAKDGMYDQLNLNMALMYFKLSQNYRHHGSEWYQTALHWAEVAQDEADRGAMHLMAINFALSHAELAGGS